MQTPFIMTDEHQKSQNATGYSWRTLILSGLLGYAMAVMTIVGGPTTTSSTAFAGFDHRLLNKEEVDVVVEESFGRVEEVEEASGEQGEEEADSTTMDITVAVIVLLLIILTILFEEIKEHVEHSAPTNMKPIIGSLFGELTVLGFLSIFTFCVTKLGFFEQLSVQIFGHEEEEELLEMFESVHYMLFFVMVFFVIGVLGLVRRAKDVERKWRMMNRACQNSEYMNQVYAMPNSDHPKTYFGFLCDSIKPNCNSQKSFVRDLKLFAANRTEFLLERSLSPPFEPHSNNTNGKQNLPKDFHFGRYLSINLAHTLQHSVHIQKRTWATFGVLTIIICGLLWGVENETAAFAWIWAGFGWAFFLFAKYMDFHIIQILKAIGAPEPSPTTQDSTEANSLLNSSLPAWTRIDLSTTDTKTTRQDSLFWFGKRGPKIYNVIMQIRLVFTSVYLTLLILSIYPDIAKTKSTGFVVGYIIISIFPISFRLLQTSDLPDAYLTIALSVGVHRRPHVVAQTLREEKTDRLIRAMVTMQKLKKATRDGFISPSTVGHVDASSGVISDVAKTFDVFDTSDDGVISPDELESLMTTIGSPPSAESLQVMVDMLDSNKDGRITKDEFLAFYVANIVITPDEKSLHHLAHDIFGDFDSDHSGEITLTEFKDILEAFDVEFTLDEIGLLVNELDEHDNGTISEHEFFELLEKHKQLFEDQSAPSLE